MAKFSTTATVFICLFTFSLAHTPLKTPEIDDVTTEVSLPLSDVTTAVSLPLADVNPIISYPSEPVNANDNPLSQPTVTTPVTAEPLTAIRFRHINRRFSKFPRHHHQHFFKVDPMKLDEIPYGDDMIVSSGENSDFQDLENLHSGSRQRVKLHHRHHHHDEESDSDSDSDSDDDDRAKRIIMKRHDSDRFGRDKKLKKMKKHFHHENIEEEEHRQKDKGGFMKRVRKFLDYYF